MFALLMFEQQMEFCANDTAVATELHDPHFAATEGTTAVAPDEDIAAYGEAEGYLVGGEMVGPRSVEWDHDHKVFLVRCLRMDRKYWRSRIAAESSRRGAGPRTQVNATDRPVIGRGEQHSAVGATGKECQQKWD
ncbi:MAG TPA: hypothetical protein VFM71_00100 [Gemmatimonadaceae bacterium]|nr:hypothetical protein [Gemmatimonadaceae bacterium]